MTAASGSDSNTVERAVPPIARDRKNALFAGSHGGGGHWAILATSIETVKLKGIDSTPPLVSIVAPSPAAIA